MKFRFGDSLPDNWSWEFSGDVIDIRDGTHDTPKYLPDGIPLVTSKNLKSYGIDFENIGHISEDDHLAISKRSAVDRDDVLFAMIGTIGNPVIVEDDREFSIKNIALFKSSKGRVTPRYCFRLLDSPLVKRQLDSATRGGTQKFVSLKVLRGLQIPLPPLAEQQRIATILDATDALRAKRRESLVELDALLQSTFLTLFGDPVENPMGWEVGVIGDLLQSANYGTSKKADPEHGAYPVLRMNNITYSGEWDFRSLKYIDLEERDLVMHLVHKGQILFNRTNSRELVGKTAVFRSEVPMAFAGYLVRGVVNNYADPEYVGTFMNTPQMKKFLRSKCKSIVGMANINAKEFQAIPIPIPPLDLQRRFATIVESIEQQKAHQRAHLTELDALFASLQHRAFNGEL